MALRDWAHTGVSDLITHLDEINRLNVFPVADSDTGANMLFTMRSALAQVDSTGGAGPEHPEDPSTGMSPRSRPRWRPAPSTAHAAIPG
ncbi:hypothetical protein I551_3124 [Mycobacterium ulcerans str. Harvey]|uniref:DhaL domain-containing protein n=1 Tax=Mycobacterium ulcerans str. Harvey TaxID=1299332 RepID=A0ABN0R0P8_MYCUL|nr:hypothetical protein I551_3124 [Mycobacterium ulcerans str. Harvey]